MASSKKTTITTNDLLLDLRKAMRKQGDSSRAIAQQAYMKSSMPYHGLTSAEVRVICKETFADYDFSDVSRWCTDVLGIWRGADKREERYAAIALVQSSSKTKKLHTIEILPMLEEMIVTGAWWDYVDALAAHSLSQILMRERLEKKTKMHRTMLDWSKCDDMWKQRSSIIAQLPFKQETDLDLLYACIEPSLDRKEFWLRKAIGWALRQYAWTDPKEVLRYVKENEDRLSPLSKKEALKNVSVSKKASKKITSSPKRAAKRKSA